VKREIPSNWAKFVRQRAHEAGVKGIDAGHFC
jgi:hypothetical protein